MAANTFAARKNKVEFKFLLRKYNHAVAGLLDHKNVER
ncbi:hypothetical protein BH10BAC3_BH10BAC3_33800 [soil metagenome]